MKKVIAYSDTSGAIYWRLIFPFEYIRYNPHWSAFVSLKGINEEEVTNADIVVLHNIVDKKGLDMIFKMGKKVVVDVDDNLSVGKTNPYYKQHKVLDANKIISETIRQANAVTTTNEYLADKLKRLNSNTLILPNYYHPKWFGVSKIDNNTDDIRIGWTGSSSHFEDIKFICPIMNKIMDKYPQVKFVVCGDFRFKNYIKHQSRLEVYEPTSFEAYPMRLSSMALDIGIAPLTDNDFNRSKSNIKFLEYSLLKIPSVCSKIVYNNYSLLTAESSIDWIIKLSKLIENKDFRVKIGKSNYKYVKDNFNLENHYKEWIDVYSKL